MFSSTTSYYSNFHILVYKLKMIKKLAKLKYLPNNFKIVEEGDHVICAISGKIIKLENLNYWNIDLQEPYFSYVEASRKRENK
jgi:hypothetical protein